MEPVLAFLTLSEFFQFFRGQLHFAKRRGNEHAHKIEVHLNFLCSLGAALAVTLMDKDFVDKLVEHSNGQIVKTLVLVNKRDKILR